MRMRNWSLVSAGIVGSFFLGWFLAGRQAEGVDGKPAATGGGEAAPTKGWTKGKGWGPWGKDDEVGALNAMTPATIKAALSLAKEGKVYDLGINYDAESFKWPGHAPAAIMTFRGPERVAWHSCAIFMSDNVATQIDGLARWTRRKGSSPSTSTC